MLKKTSLIVVLLGLFCMVAGKAQEQKQIDPAFEKYQKPGGSLPELKMATEGTKVFTNKDLKTNGHLFLVVFNPTCSHCIKMTKLFCKNADLFADSKVIFMAKDNMKSYLPDYEKKTGIKKHPEFILGVDQSFAIDKLANYGLLPMINVYDKQQKLVRTFNGDIPLDTLKQYIP